MKILTGLVLLVAFLAPQRAFAASDPDVAQFITAFNAGTRSAIGAYVAAHVLPAPAGMEAPDTAQALEQLRQAIGPITLRTHCTNSLRSASLGRTPAISVTYA